ncbi:AraC family transcriptional regulator [Bauldia sp.]|uniref:AraC family transcriptional regulator n=1 Tax=Bauldia sp. TaxID=2575872 RepID=UPI003BACD957
MGSQAIDFAGSVAGLDISVPEVFRFGFAHFPTAVATSDSWTSHDGAEIVFMLDGEACWELEGDFLVPLYGGQSALFTSSLRHRITNGIYPPSSTFWIVLSGPERAAEPALLTAESCRKFQGDLGKRGLTRSIQSKCLESIHELTRLMKDKRLYSGHELTIAEIRAHLHLVLIETWKAHRYRQPHKGDSAIVERVLEAMHADCGNGVSISQLAKKLGCSRGHLYNQFRDIVGMPPSDYAQRLRIKQSCRALSSEDASITTIAHENGFSSSQHFSRVFKRYLGVTPSGYRSQIQKIGPSP